MQAPEAWDATQIRRIMSHPLGAREADHIRKLIMSSNPAPATMMSALIRKRLYLLALFLFLLPLLVAAEADSEPAPALPTPPQTPRPSRAELNQLIDRMAKRYQVEKTLVHAIVRAESNYNPHAVSHAGAIGLMQVMPETAADYGVSAVEDLFDPSINARTGTRHLKRLLGKYGIGQAVMAYNAGEGALDRSQGFVTYPETQRYTHRVLSQYLRAKGIEPYSMQARQLTGLSLNPAMARAGTNGPQRLRVLGKDISRLSLRLRPSLLDSPLSKHALNPSAHRVGPESKPMFVLEGVPGLERR